MFVASDRLYHTTAKCFQVVECKSCRLLRLEPKPTLEELAQYYPPDYWYAPDESSIGRLQQTYRRIVLRDHVNFVLAAIKDSGERGLVLDVGCGGGLFLRLLADTGLPVLGLDLSLDAASVAWNRNGVPAILGSLDQAPLPRGCCGAVTMFHILEHVYDPLPYVQHARALLRPDGRLIVQVPNASCWQFLLLGEHWNGLDVPRHLVNFRLGDMLNLLDHGGFEVLRVKHFSLRDNPAGLATSLAPGLDPMARRVRGAVESPLMRGVKDLAYLCLVAGAFPFTALEAACRAGSTIMLEARPKR